MLERSSSIEVGTVGGLVLLVHSVRPMGDPDWGRVVDAMWEVGRATQRVRVLVFTPGPAPNANQRLKIAEISERYPMRVAVCTGSRVARAVLLAIEWASKLDIRPFASSEEDMACDYLEVPNEERSAVITEFQRMRREMS